MRRTCVPHHRIALKCNGVTTTEVYTVHGIPGHHIVDNMAGSDTSIRNPCVPSRYFHILDINSVASDINPGLIGGAVTIKRSGKEVPATVERNI